MNCCPECHFDLRQVYLFQDARSKKTHAVHTKHAVLGAFDLDRIYGGGFKVFCGRKAAGKGVISSGLMSVAHVTCQECLKALGKPSTPEKEVWPPEHTRLLDRPIILGIPG